MSIISKFQEYQIKTGVIVMTMSNRGFCSNQGDETLRILRSDQASFHFSNQGHVTLRFMIGSGQFSILFEISSMST